MEIISRAELFGGATAIFLESKAWFSDFPLLSAYRFAEFETSIMYLSFL